MLCAFTTSWDPLHNSVNYLSFFPPLSCFVLPHQPCLRAPHRFGGHAEHTDVQSLSLLSNQERLFHESVIVPHLQFPRENCPSHERQTMNSLLTPTILMHQHLSVRETILKTVTKGASSNFLGSRSCWQWEAFGGCMRGISVAHD